MSKRAEEAALIMFPVHPAESIERMRKKQRKVFIMGYEQAEKDTIERAVAWLKDYVKYFEIYDEKGVEEFKKAMEEEQ